MKKTSKITSLFLAASLMISVTPTQTNCGVFRTLGRFIKSRKGVQAVGLTFAIGGIFASWHKKDQKIKSGISKYVPFYLKNFGSVFAYLSEKESFWRIFCVFPIFSIILGKRRTKAVNKWIQQQIDKLLPEDDN